MTMAKLLNVVRVGLLLFLACAPHPLRDASDLEKRVMLMQLTTEYAAKWPAVRRISAAEWVEMRQNGNPVLVDVREREEYDISRIPGAVFVGDFESDAARHAGRPVVCYCTVGYRSAEYASELMAKGLAVYELEGSILGWLHEERPIVDASGKTTMRVHVYGASWDYAPSAYERVW